MRFPARSEYSDYFHTYVSHVPTVNPLELLEKTLSYTLELLEKVPNDMYDYRYAPGKWTIKELLMHMIDCEQILSYRALRFVRGDRASALPFDENNYVAAINTENLSWDYIIKSTQILRDYTIHLFSGITEEESQLEGSEAFPCTARAVAAIIAGHQLHHIYVLQERYLKQPIQLFEL